MYASVKKYDGEAQVDTYKVTWISHNIHQQALIQANSASEAINKVKRSRPHGEFKGISATKV